MRIHPSQTPASPSSSSPVSFLSMGSARTPGFRALFPQLRLLGRVLRELRPQQPQWPPPRSGPHGHGGRGHDGFVPVCRGRGIPIRLSDLAPGTGQARLRLRPWSGSLLRPWCGLRLKPWFNLPHIFRPLPRPGGPDAGGDACCGCGSGIPIRIS